MVHAKALAIAVICGSVMSSQGHAAALTAADILGQFNAVITKNFTSNSDVEGRLVANDMVGAATLYNNQRGTAAASAYAAVNAITVGSGVNANVNDGGNVNVQGGNSGHFSFNGGHLVSTPAFTIADFATPLTNLAMQLAALAANSTVNGSDPNNFTFNAAPNAQGLAIFSLTAASLATARNIDFNLNGATTAVVDVTGGSFTDTSNFNATDFINRHVIWDFSQATILAFSGWHGSVLAPLASVSNTSAMEGDLFARNFTGSGELHDFTFAGILPSDSNRIPEPASILLLGAGLAGVWRARRRA